MMTLELGTIAVNMKPHIEFLFKDANDCNNCGGIGVVTQYVGYAVMNGRTLAKPELTACPTCKGNGGG